MLLQRKDEIFCTETLISPFGASILNNVPLTLHDENMHII